MEQATGPKRFVDRGVSIPCVQSGLSDDESLEFGGMNTQQLIVLTVRLSAYNESATDKSGKPVRMEPPVKKTRINFEGQEYRIARIKSDSFGVFLKFYCECPNEGI